MFTDTEIRETVSYPFSAQSQSVLRQAEIEARVLKHNYLGTEHLLLGLVGSDNAARDILYQSRIHPSMVSDSVEFLMGSGSRPAPEDLSATPRWHRALTEAAEEARTDGVSEVTPLHILRGILLEGESVGFAVLESLSQDIVSIYQQAGGRWWRKVERNIRFINAGAVFVEKAWGS